VGLLPGGIYDYPRHSKALGGPTSPDIDQIAHALARKFAWRIQPNGATAQNLLGLSTQLPAHAVYLSDGPDRSYTVGRTKLDFEHTALKEAGFKLPESRLIVQALRAFGEGRITPKVITQERAIYSRVETDRVVRALSLRRGPVPPGVLGRRWPLELPHRSHGTSPLPASKPSRFRKSGHRCKRRAA
jgi:hypothetical protein